MKNLLIILLFCSSLVNAQSYEFSTMEWHSFDTLSQDFQLDTSLSQPITPWANTVVFNQETDILFYCSELGEEILSYKILNCEVNVNYVRYECYNKDTDIYAVFIFPTGRHGCIYSPDPEIKIYLY